MNNSQITDTNPIYTISDLIHSLNKKIEILQRDSKELAEAKATMLLNCGDSGRFIKGLCKENDSMPNMLLKLYEYHENTKIKYRDIRSRKYLNVYFSDTFMDDELVYETLENITKLIQHDEKILNVQLVNLSNGLKRFYVYTEYLEIPIEEL